MRWSYMGILPIRDGPKFKRPTLPSTCCNVLDYWRLVPKTTPDMKTRNWKHEGMVKWRMCNGNCSHIPKIYAIQKQQQKSHLQLSIAETPWRRMCNGNCSHIPKIYLYKSSSRNLICSCPLPKLLGACVCRSISENQTYGTFSNSPPQHVHSTEGRSEQNGPHLSTQRPVRGYYRYSSYSSLSLFHLCLAAALPFQRNSSSGSRSIFDDGKPCTNTEETYLLGFSAEHQGGPKSESHSADDTEECGGFDDFRRICKMIKMGEEDMEAQLTRMSVKLSPELVRDVLSHTSDHGGSALRFFTWAKYQTGYSHNSAVYNEMVNIAGRHRDFQGMRSLIVEMTAKGHCLTATAFSFIVCNSSNKSTVKGLLQAFSKLEGPARKSAFQGLLSALCRGNCFEVANWIVQEMTDRGQLPSASYYNYLIAVKCRNGKLTEAKGLLDEMMKSGCEPNINTYNYLLGTMCKTGKIIEACQLLEAMEKSGHLPDPITYEILIFSACKSGKMDGALEYLNKMIAEGLRPRYSSYAAFIKVFFHFRQYEKAYKFVVNISKRDPSATSMNYTLLLGLFEKSGNMLEAQNLLLQMIEKGLVPNYTVCRKIIKSLMHSGKHDIAEEIQCKLTEIMKN